MPVGRKLDEMDNTTLTVHEREIETMTQNMKSVKEKKGKS